MPASAWFIAASCVGEPSNRHLATCGLVWTEARRLNLNRIVTPPLWPCFPRKRALFAGDTVHTTPGFRKLPAASRSREPP